MALCIITKNILLTNLEIAMINPAEFNQLFHDIVKPKKLADTQYRLYYNSKTGEALQYTTDTLDGTFINITKKQYEESRYDSIVINKKLTSINEAERWLKLVPSDQGIACAVDNVMIVDKNSSAKWKLKTYLAE